MAEVSNTNSQNVSNSAVHQEGVEHIKDQVFGEQPGGTTGTTGVSSNPEPIAPAQPPASNPGCDDPTAGIAADAGGVSNTAHIESPVQASGQDEVGVVGKVLGLLGLSSTSVEPEREAADVDARNAGTAGPAAATDGAIATGAAGAVAGGALASQSGDIPDRTSSSAPGGSSGGDTGVFQSTLNRYKGDDSTSTGTSTGANTEAIAGQSSAAHTDSNAPSTMANISNAAGGNDTAPQYSSEAGVAQSSDSAGNENTNTTVRDDTENKNLPDQDTSGENGDKPPTHEGQKGKSLENREAIPTAGGQKLGDKHWGESQIVPDNPPKRQSEAGIASKDGQPTGETATNTAANTGGATGGPGHEGAGQEKDKQKLTDKIKDKLHIGKKE